LSDSHTGNRGALLRGLEHRPAATSRQSDHRVTEAIHRPRQRGSLIRDVHRDGLAALRHLEGADLPALIIQDVVGAPTDLLRLVRGLIVGLLALDLAGHPLQHRQPATQILRTHSLSLSSIRWRHTSTSSGPHSATNSDSTAP